MLLKDLISKMFANTLYVKVFINRYELRHIESGKAIDIPSEPPFTTDRLLVGEFDQASAVLKKGMVQVYSGVNKLFLPSPAVIIQPMAMAEGGLSQVEERCLQELAMVSGARKAIVYVGEPLRDQEILLLK